MALSDVVIFLLVINFIDTNLRLKRLEYSIGRMLHQQFEFQFSIEFTNRMRTVIHSV